MLASLAPATVLQYSGHIKHWLLFCQSANIDPYEGKPADVLKFLVYLFPRGASYGTLNSARSAVVLIADSPLADGRTLHRYFKGVFRL